MKASYRWLSALLPELEQDAHAVSERLRNAGLVVGAVDEIGSPARPGARDWILDVTDPKGGTFAGHVGLARDVAALFNLPFQPPGPIAPARVAQSTVTKHASAAVDDVAGCPVYSAAVVVEVEVAASPEWLRRRLEALGEPSVCNVVDATTLSRLELGHPTAAYDLALLRGARVVIRRARLGERIVTLDGVERSLEPDDLVVADSERPVALAGVLLGDAAAIRPETRVVLVECAAFDPAAIARTEARHGLQTATSGRFVRGVEATSVPDVLAHTASLLTELARGTAVPGTLLLGSP